MDNAPVEVEAWITRWLTMIRTQLEEQALSLARQAHKKSVDDRARNFAILFVLAGELAKHARSETNKNEFPEEYFERPDEYVKRPLFDVVIDYLREEIHAVLEENGGATTVSEARAILAKDIDFKHWFAD